MLHFWLLCFPSPLLLVLLLSFLFCTFTRPSINHVIFDPSCASPEELKRQTAALEGAQVELSSIQDQLAQARSEIETIKAVATVSENTKQEAIDQVRSQWQEEVASLQAIMKGNLSCCDMNSAVKTSPIICYHLTKNMLLNAPDVTIMMWKLDLKPWLSTNPTIKLSGVNYFYYTHIFMTVRIGSDNIINDVVQSLSDRQARQG